MKTASCIAGWIILLSLIGNVSAVSAQSQSILPIQPTPSVANSSLGAARIDELISTEEIVIDDMRFRIARNATFFDKGHQRQVSLYFFKVGDRVRYTTNEDGEIDDMWVFSEDAP
jgi:hypothetical protein